jgi:hypothetical protein
VRAASASIDRAATSRFAAMRAGHPAQGRRRGDRPDRAVVHGADSAPRNEVSRIMVKRHCAGFEAKTGPHGLSLRVCALASDLFCLYHAKSPAPASFHSESVSTHIRHAISPVVIPIFVSNSHSEVSVSQFPGASQIRQESVVRCRPSVTGRVVLRRANDSKTRFIPLPATADFIHEESADEHDQDE